MNPLTTIADFLKEMLHRIATRSPAFFRVIQLVTALLTFAGYVPSILQQWFDVTISGNVITLCESIAKYSTGFFAASMLSAKSTIVGQTESGVEVRMTDESKMPFSAKKEQKELDKAQPQPEVIADVPIK
jgi:hypothetical protein